MASYIGCDQKMVGQKIFSPLTRIADCNMVLTKKDSGWAWVMLVAGVFNTAISLGVAIACGVYVAAIIEYYRCSKAVGYVLGSLSYAFCFGIAPVASLLIRKTSHRTVSILGGLSASIVFVGSANIPGLHYQYLAFAVAAAGCGCLYISSILVVMASFNKYQALSASLILTAGGLGHFIYPLFCQLIIDLYTWQSSFYIVAGVMLNTIVFSSLMKPLVSTEDEKEVTIGVPPIISSSSLNINNRLYERKEFHSDMVLNNPTEDDKALFSTEIMSYENQSQSNDDSSNIANKTLIVHDLSTDESHNCISIFHLKKNHKINASYFLLACSCLLWSGPISLVYVVSPDMYNMGRIPDSEQSILFLVFGVSSIVGRIFPGLILSFRLTSPSRLYCVVNFIWSIGLSVFMFNSYFFCLFAANITVGFFFGSFIALSALVALEFVGEEKLGEAIGVINLLIGLSGVMLPPLIGLMYDVTKDYTGPLVLAASMSLLSALVIVPPAFCWR